MKRNESQSLGVRGENVTHVVSVMSRGREASRWRWPGVGGVRGSR